MPDQLSAHLACVEAEIGRTDSKASLLLAFTGAAGAGLVSAAPALAHAILAAQVAAGATAIVLVLAADLLLRVVRPNLSGDDRSSFPHFAQCTDDEITEAATADTRAARIRVLSRLVHHKFARLQRACDLLRAALVLGLLAAALTALSVSA